MVLGKTGSNTCRKFTYILSIIMFLSINLANAQSRCNSICDQDKDCKSGKCFLSECRDTELCFEFCFLCSGQKTCFASGSHCENIVYLNSNMNKLSIKLTLTMMILVFFTIYLFIN